MHNIYSKIMLIIFILFSSNGCDGNSKNETNKTITKSNIVIKVNKKESKEDKILKKIGITEQNGKIIIDPKKTKSFLDNLSKTLEKEAKKFESKTKDIDEDELGIHISKDKIIIDANKTKSFLENFAKELESVAKDIKESIDK